MPDAFHLLFQNLFLDKPLFDNQLELVKALMNDPDTAYFVAEEGTERYHRQRSKLKTYLSQMFSNSVARSVTDEFKSGLITVLQKKLQGTDHDVYDLVNKIVTDLREKNAAKASTEQKSRNPSEDFLLDMSSARYIAVMTSRPLEIGVPEQPAFPPLRRLLFNDLISRLFNQNLDLKFYRFNFPQQSYCELLWRGLRKVLFQHLKEHLSFEYINAIKFKFKHNDLNLPDEVEQLKGNALLIEKIVDQILHLLNRERYILTFVTRAPIYSLPMIVMNPIDNKKIKVYAMLDMNPESMSVFKLPENETLLYRIFVWDQLKTTEYGGKEVKYLADPQNF